MGQLSERGHGRVSRQRFSLPHGFDIVFWGNIPNGAGLSSSASIELVTAVILKECHELKADMLDLVKLAQTAENSFIGVSCGIMDQFAIGMGKKHHAILLNCGTLSFEYTKLGLSGLSIVIANTNKNERLQTQAIIRGSRSAGKRFVIFRSIFPFNHWES